MDKLFLSELAKKLADIATNEQFKATQDGENSSEALDGDDTAFLADRFLVELDILQGNV